PPKRRPTLGSPCEKSWKSLGSCSGSADIALQGSILIGVGQVTTRLLQGLPGSRQIPRGQVAAALRRYAAAAMDISDGLVGDFAKMLAASSCGGVLWHDRVPLSIAAQKVVGGEPALYATALTGGDDYEIAACIPLADLDAFLTEVRAHGIEATVIGETRAQAGLDLVDAAGVALPLSARNFSHF
ncbi:MAG: hypothetical protein B7Z15_01760, partial [Rhizobiales bacterium 32-66-8]